jgi:hypothetical protein
MRQQFISEVLAAPVVHFRSLCSFNLAFRLTKPYVVNIHEENIML